MANTEGSKPDEETPEQIFNRMMTETEGLVPKGFAQQVEKDFCGTGKLAIARRMAMVYLEKPFKEIVEGVRSDREFAVATAHVSEVLRGHIEPYKALAGWIEAAYTRMWMSIAIREDMEEVFREAKADAERVRNDDLHQARFLKQLKRDGKVKP